MTDIDMDDDELAALAAILLPLAAAAGAELAERLLMEVKR